MKSNTLRFFLLLLLFPLCALAQNSTQARKDSLWRVLDTEEGKEKLLTYARLGALYFAESKDSLKRDTMLTVYGQMDAEAKQQGNAAQQGVARYNILTAFNNNQMYDEIFRRTPADLKELAKPDGWKYYYMCYNALIDAYCFSGDLRRATEEAQQMYNHAKEQQSHEGMAMALYSMSDIYDRQGRQKDFEQSLRQCIDLIKDDKSLLPITTKAWFDVCQTLLTQSRYDELPEATQAFEKANEAYEAIAGEPVATTRGNLWGVYARWYVNTGEYDKAEEYCNKIDSLIQGVRYQLISLHVRARILNARGQYAEALEKINEALVLESAHPKEANTSRGIKMEILANMGRYQEAYQLFGEYNVVNDSLRSVEVARQIDDLRTQYGVDKLIGEKKIRSDQLIIAIGGCTLLLVILLIYIIYSRRLRAKKIGLVKQIQEQDRLYKKLEDEKKEQERLRQLFTETTGQQPIVEERDELFENLEKLMKEKQPYTDPELNRKLLAEKLGTNEKYLRETIRKHYNMTVSEYITSLRLRRAKELLLLPAEKYTIGAVAIDSGFGSLSTFHALFRDHYELTPDEFRRFAVE